MLKPLLNAFLSHLLQQNQWAHAALQPMAGRTVAIHLVLLQAKLTVGAQGQLSMAAQDAVADASLHLNPSTMLRLMRGDHSASQLIRLEGDSELAMRFSQVLSEMRWDVVQDLSLVIGDIPAHQIQQFTQAGVRYAKQQSQNWAEMLVEYWQEEQALLAKQRHVSAFITAVDGLRDDSARLEKRIHALQRRLAAKASAAKR